MADPISNSSPSPRRRRRWIIAASVIGVIAVLVGAKVYFCGHRHGWGGPMSTEVINERIEHGVRYVLSDVNATAEQKAKVTTILKATATDVTSLRDRHLADAKRIREILSAPSIDRASLESVRAEELSLADAASKRLVQGLADSADVLTPAQRTQLIAKLESHHRWRNGSN
jgi:Spy/CpxP family protein refolding chaperone